MTAPVTRSWKFNYAALEGLIRDQRKAKGVTQADIVRRIMISRSKVQRFDRGEGVLDAFELFRLADMLDIEITATVRTEGVKSDASQEAA